MNETPRGRIRVFACGGAGINLGKRIQGLADAGRDNKTDAGSAEIIVTHIDTSRSNLSGVESTDNIYLIDGLDGSGKVRRENYEQITEHVKNVLQKFPAGDLSIVISSASGGSGSVIGPSLTGLLLAREQPVIVIMVGATDSRLDIENTHKTIKSYEAIAQRTKAPVCAFYWQNSKETPRQQVDEDVLRAVSFLAVLFSRQNAEMDTKDLFNFLRFDRVTSYPVQLAGMNVVLFDDVDAANSLISVATLARPGMDVSMASPPDYQTTGYMPEGVAANIASMAPFHIVTRDQAFNDVSINLDKRLQALADAAAARTGSSKVLNKGDQITDTGLVL
jgi:hypothetical protein